MLSPKILFMILLVLTGAPGWGEESPIPADRKLTHRDFTSLDKTVGQLPDFTDPQALVQALTALSQDDLDKARALYDWEATHIEYDAPAYLDNSISNQANQPLEVFRLRKAVCLGYSLLYRYLAQKMGLECELVSGKVKSLLYDKTKVLEDHAWNGVKINGGWILVDCTWGSGWLEESGHFKKSWEPFYFNPDPELFFLTHDPLDRGWSFSAQPRKGGSFASEPEVSPGLIVTLYHAQLSPGDLLNLFHDQDLVANLDPWLVIYLSQAGLSMDSIRSVLHDKISPSSTELLTLTRLHRLGFTEKSLVQLIRRAKILVHFDELFKEGASEEGICRLGELAKEDFSLDGFDLLCWVKVGVPEKRLIAALETHCPLPYIYDTFNNDPAYVSQSLRLEDVPLSDTLVAGQTYSFRIASSVYKKMAVLVEHNGKSVRQVPMGVSENQFSAQLAFNSGDMVTLLYNVQGEQFYGIVAYRVKKSRS